MIVYIDFKNQLSRSRGNSLKPLWPFWSTILVSIIFGPIASLFVVWQNLVRIGKKNLAKKFFIAGSLLLFASSLLFSLVIFLVSSSLFQTLFGSYEIYELPKLMIASLLPIWVVFSAPTLLLPLFSIIISLVFPYWFYVNKETKTDLKTKFDGLILFWGGLGFAISFLFVFSPEIIDGLAGKIKPSSLNLESKTTNISKTSEQIKECESLTYNPQKEFEFVDQVIITEQLLIDKIYLSFTDIDYFKEKFNISENILQLDYSEPLNKVIYLTGEDFSKNKNHLREIIAFDLKNKTQKTLFSYQTQLLEDPNQNKMVPDANKLRNFSLSPDKKKILILTDESISLYNLITNKSEFSLLASQFDQTIKEKNFDVTIDNKFYFWNAIFSPNMRYVVLEQVYWEVASYFLLDLSNKKISYLNKSGYNSGSHVYTWLNNDEIIFTDTEKNKVDHQAVCVETIKGENTRCLQLLANNVFRLRALSNGKVLGDLEREDNMQKHRGCNNLKNIFEFNSRFISLYELSFTDNKKSELLHVDSTKVFGFKNKTNILGFIPYVFEGKNVILVKLSDNTGQEIFAFLDESKPEKLTKINLNGGIENWITASIPGLEFKYPQDYEGEKKGNDLFIAYNHQLSASIMLVKDPEKYEDWIKTIREDISRNDVSVKKQQFERYQAYFESRMSAEGIFERNCFVMAGDDLIILTVSADTRLFGNEEPEIYGKVEQLADQIFSTFMFLNLNQTTDSPSLWWTYTATAAGISEGLEFRLPADFKKESEKGDVLNFISDKYFLEIFWDSDLSYFYQQLNGKVCTAYPFCLDIERGYVELTVDGKKAFSAQILSDQDNLVAYTFIIRNNQKAVFVRLRSLGSLTEKENQELIELRDKIVNTMKIVYG